MTKKTIATMEFNVVMESKDLKNVGDTVLSMSTYRRRAYGKEVTEYVASSLTVIGWFAHYGRAQQVIVLAKLRDDGKFRVGFDWSAKQRFTDKQLTNSTDWKTGVEVARAKAFREYGGIFETEAEAQAEADEIASEKKAAARKQVQEEMAATEAGLRIEVKGLSQYDTSVVLAGFAPNGNVFLSIRKGHSNEVYTAEVAEAIFQVLQNARKARKGGK